VRNDCSPRQLAEAIGVSESSVKRWIDEGTIAASRTAGGHRRVRLSEAVRFVRASGMPIVRPEVLGLVDLKLAAGSRSGAEAAFEQALVEGRADVVRGIVLSRFLDGEPPATICDGPVASAMHAIGELWRNDPAGIAVEHRATELCLQALGLVRSLVPAATAGAPAAVGCAPAGDPYLLPTFMSAFVLEADGWRATNFGPDFPLERLAEAAEAECASLAWVSVTSESAGADLVREIRELAERLARSGIRLIAGGRALPRSLEVPGAPYSLGRTMRDLVASAREVQESATAAAIRLPA